jgi:hypothetical protein
MFKLRDLILLGTVLSIYGQLLFLQQCAGGMFFLLLFLFLTVRVFKPKFVKGPSHHLHDVEPGGDKWQVAYSQRLQRLKVSESP